MDKFSALFWENYPSSNLIINGNTKIEEKGLGDFPIDLIDELEISRDEQYRIKISCARNISILNNKVSSRKKRKKEFLPGEEITPGELMIKPYGDTSSIVFSPCYYEGCISTFTRSEYQLSCNHVV